MITLKKHDNFILLERNANVNANANQIILQLENQLENINLKLLENMSNIFEIMIKWIDILSTSVVKESYEIKEWIKTCKRI